VIQSISPLLIISETWRLSPPLIVAGCAAFTAHLSGTPAFGDRRRGCSRDICLTSGEVITELGLKLENTQLNQLSRGRKVVITKDNTTVVGPGCR